jgi:Domain of unknown function (DUF6438)
MKQHKIACIILGFFVSAAVADRICLAAGPSETVITLERTTCFGTCPSYKLSILRDGTVNYEGREYVRVKGTAHSKIDSTAVNALIREFIKID